MTLFRKHPLWNLSASVLQMILTGTFQGAFLFVFYGTPNVEVLFGINTVYMLYNFFGSNLRHSHIWLSWGKPLSYVFISPAMHQIHHDPTRMNKNYGEMFALWDWMFGTLYIPKRRETFAIGLGESNPHDTLARAYYVPVVEMYRQIKTKLRKS
ncbi:MAG: sterol desaturase family protein [Gammaproteobacteria bacterium]|nr:sterol desaturase family protein [Gammaproteobacteria bacterium]